jgi:hypothetical protein
VFGQVRPHGEVLVLLEEAFPGVVLSQQGDMGPVR